MNSISLLRIYVGKGRYLSFYTDSIILEYHSDVIIREGGGYYKTVRRVTNAKLLLSF